MMQDNDDPGPAAASAEEAAPEDPPTPLWRRRAAKFPRKLYQLLEDSHEEDNVDIVCWMTDGRSFKVIDRDRFAEEIMPRYFGAAKFRSYQKNLSVWKFMTISLSVSSPRRGESRHEFFVRGHPELIGRMKRKHMASTFQHSQRVRVDNEDTSNVPLPHPVSGPSSSSDNSSLSVDTSNQNSTTLGQLAGMPSDNSSRSNDTSNQNSTTLGQLSGILSLLQQEQYNATRRSPETTDIASHAGISSRLLQSAMRKAGAQQIQRPGDVSITATASANSTRNHILQPPIVGPDRLVQSDLGATAEVLLSQLLNTRPASNQVSPRQIPGHGTSISRRPVEGTLPSSLATALLRHRHEQQFDIQDERQRGQGKASPPRPAAAGAPMPLTHVLGRNRCLAVGTGEETARQYELLIQQLNDNVAPNASASACKGGASRNTQAILRSLLGSDHHHQRHSSPVPSRTTQQASPIPSTQRRDDAAIQAAILSMLGSGQQQQQQQGHSSLAASRSTQQTSSLPSTHHRDEAAVQAAILSLLVGSGQQQQQGHPSLSATRTTQVSSSPSTGRRDETAVQAAVLSLLGPDQQQILFRLQQALNQR